MFTEYTEPRDISRNPTQHQHSKTRPRYEQLNQNLQDNKQQTSTTKFENANFSEIQTTPSTEETSCLRSNCGLVNI